MKQVKARKFISFGIAVLFALSGLLVLFPISVFAETVSITFVNNSGMNITLYLSEAREYLISSGASRSLTFSAPELDSVSFFNAREGISFCGFYDGRLLSSDPSSPTYIGVLYSSTVVISSVEWTGGDFSIFVVDGYTPSPSTPSTPPTPTPTLSPSPTPSPTPSVDSFYSPFKSFAGTYYNDTALFFPNSVTKHQYAQYSGIVADHDMTITDIRSTLQYNAGNYVVYKFEYDILPLTSADFRFDFLFDSDSDLPSVYVSYLFNGQVYECDDFEQTYLTGIYTQYGAFDIDPTQTFGPPFYHWDVDLTSQRSLGVEIDGLKHDNTSVTPITLTLYISSTPMPGFGSSFDWAQLFEDTRPDSAFLTTVSSLSSLPFFVGGLGFLALGAVIGIVLKFMR